MVQDNMVKTEKRKPSNYSVQLAEKQKARFMYGISEKQFKKISK